MTATARGIVTPEAVVLEFETAGLASRLGAAFLDALVQVSLLVVVLLAAFGLSEAGLELGGLAQGSLYVFIFLLLFGYPTAFETMWRGRTLGKAAMGLRVVTIEGGPVRFRHAAIRAMLGLFDKYLFSGLVGVIAVLVTPRNQRIGDLVAGTIVLRERSGAAAPSAVQFRPPLGAESYAATLDVSRLEHEDYGVVRSFLLRAPSLSGAARHQLASSLAASLVDRLRTTPPPGMPPEVFLACVAAAHQARHAPSAIARATPTPSFTSVWADPPVARGPDVFAAPAARPPGPTLSDDGFEAPG
jgi:uncharacterized RDD family membrane protein YckC